jgi:hypothetical protein
MSAYLQRVFGNLFMIPITGAGLSSRFIAFLFTDHSRGAETDH